MKNENEIQDKEIFTHEIAVTWGDCDPAKIAFTGKLPEFSLTAINAWWEKNLGYGWYQMEVDHNIGTPFVNMNMNFISPVTPRHRLLCKVWPNKVGTTSIGFRVEGWQNQKLCFEGSFVCVFIIAGEFRKQPFPPKIRKLLESYLIEDKE